MEKYNVVIFVETVILVCGVRYASNSMVDIVVKDWCKLVDLFCKFFLIKCHDGKQGLLQFPRFAMLKLGGLSLTYK